MFFKFLLPTHQNLLTFSSENLSSYFWHNKVNKKARLFLHILRFLSHSLKQNFFAKQKQSKLSERGKVLPDDFGENFKVFLSFQVILTQSQLHMSCCISVSLYITYMLIILFDTKFTIDCINLVYV